jgi:16S rRNA (guanine527-N7)-methyltransferase
MSASADEHALRTPLENAGLPPSLVDRCAQHFASLSRWNRTHNLTRITSPHDAALRHYLDCALPVLGLASPPADSFIDVGSGAGFPGLVVALARPGVAATLVEPAQKRASFLRVVAGELGLRDLRVASPSSITAPWVLSRATFSSGARTELWPYVEPGGRLWVWTTLAERSQWTVEAATWPDARLSFLDYRLPELGPRCVAVIERSSGA